MFDLIIIGGGPAGVSAGVYAARKKLKTLLLTHAFGGQSTDSMGIENWIGTPKIAGPDFGKLLENHLRMYESENLVIKTAEWVEKVSKLEAEKFEVRSDRGSYLGKTILITSGSTRRKLEIPGAQEFENKGISYCASCDGPLFAGMDVAVIGGGNAGFETAAQLLAYAKSVTLFNRSENFRADEVTVEKVLSHPNMKAVRNAGLVEIVGDKFVTGIKYEDKNNHKQEMVKVTGIFVEIGLVPTTDFVKDLLQLNQYGQIPIDHRTQRTAVNGVWAAGDSTDALYHQNNIAAGDAVKALEDIYLYLHTK